MNTGPQFPKRKQNNPKQSEIEKSPNGFSFFLNAKIELGLPNDPTKMNLGNLRKKKNLILSNEKCKHKPSKILLVIKMIKILGS